MAETAPPVDRRALGLLVAAAAIALLTVGLVVRFGLVRPPELAAIDDATRPPHPVVLASFREATRDTCLHVIEPDGTVNELRCGLEGGPLIGWDDEGILVLRFGPLGERLDVIDVVTGGTLTSRSVSAEELGGRWDLSVDVERSGRTLLIRDVDRTVRWSVEVADGYQITAAVRDPATATIALLDQAGRLLVLPPDAPEPRVWVEDVGARYGELVWRGTTVMAD